MVKKAKRTLSAERKDKTNRRIELDAPYQALKRERSVDDPEEVGEAIAVRDSKRNNIFIRLMKKKWGKNHRWNKSGFNVEKPTHVGSVIRALRKIGIYLGWLKDDGDDIEALKRKLKDAREEISQFEIVKLRAGELLEEYHRIRENQALALIDKLHSELIEFETLVENFEPDNDGENAIQQFLKEHPWIFGLHYLDSTPQKPLGSTSINDFLLERLEGLFDLFELKLPSHDLFRQDDKITADLSSAIIQVIDYLDKYEGYGANIKTREFEGLETMLGKPRGFIVIGRSQDKKTRKRIDMINSYFHGIEILTYDDLIRIARSTLQNLDRQKA